MTKIHLWPEESIVKEDLITTGFTYEEAGGEHKSVWYRLPSEFAPAVTHWCDPFVLAILFKAMSTPSDLIVHGEVSPSLIFNLREFQSAWSSWLPDRYSQIEIVPDEELEHPPPGNKDAVVAFSGGADSCYTAWRYTKPKDERLPYSLPAGLFIHGYDFPANLVETFDRAFKKARIILDSLGMILIPMATNIRSLHQHPDDSGGATLASCLMLLQDRYVAGLIASAYPYAHLSIPCGSNPLTDPMMSSRSFSIRHDGAKATRIEKLKTISEWPEAMQYLRVCSGRTAAERDKNCCLCEKCVRNILEFRALGFNKLPLFEKDVTNWQILKLQYSYTTDIAHIYEDILTTANIKQISGSWISALKFSMFMNKMRFKAEKIPWINRLLHWIKHQITRRRNIHG